MNESSSSEFDRVLDYLDQTTPKLAAKLSEVDLTESDVPRIPNYGILKQIGSGGFGDVWLVRNTLDHQYYALKTLKDGRDSELSAIREFKRRIPNHPNLVPIGHVGEADGTIYYLMPLADNALPDHRMRTTEDYEPMTLMEFVNRNGKMSSDQVKALAVDLLSALETMHSAGGIHRDVKPANILMFGGVWRLSDPGLMSLCNDDSPQAGTASFRKSDSQENDIFADMYALAVTLEKIHDGKEVGPDSGPLLTAITRAKSEEMSRRFHSTKEMRAFLSRKTSTRRRHLLSLFWFATVAALAFFAGSFTAGSFTSSRSRNATPDSPLPLPRSSTYSPVALHSSDAVRITKQEWVKPKRIQGKDTLDIGFARPGGTLTCILAVPRDGNYLVYGYYFVGPSRGNFRLSLSDLEVTVDLLRDGEGHFETIAHGVVPLNGGRHELTFELLEDEEEQLFDIAVESVTLLRVD